ncbi:PLP-dependent aminotransferase family protein [Musicola keenii]|uniref:aminotransferase-like domain-containing protein n=1 Tax=Musicola keenii TaxID=2884250 RepID=UPI00178072DC|nr:PLP-dependent aminotransferase family protein [Musicola keenii]
MTRYQHLADLLAQRIEAGLYQSGERLPSVRTLSREHGVSIGTVQQAYYVLEAKRLIMPLSRSGYFVSPRKAMPPVPALTRPIQQPVEFTQWESVLALANKRRDHETLSLDGGMPDITQPTLKPLLHAIAHCGKQYDLSLLGYDSLPGLPALREQIARLMLDGGSRLGAEEIVVTSGCQESLSVAIRAVCQPGDIVAVESPNFFGVMQMLQGFGVKAIEIPTDAVSGLSLEALELALEQWPIKAVLTVPNCNNPLGFIMPDERKRALVALARRFDIAIIEDDIYGDLAYGYPRPITVKSLDTDGRVLLCSSFSKTLAPGLRVGWIVPGRYLDRVLHLKYISTGSTAMHIQRALTEFIQQGGYQPHLRRMRARYQHNLDVFACWVRYYFPSGICVSRPQGGFWLWIELPGGCNAACLNDALRGEKIRVAPGAIFSATGKYRHCLRLNYAAPFTDTIQRALQTLGAMLEQWLSEASGA